MTINGTSEPSHGDSGGLSETVKRLESNTGRMEQWIARILQRCGENEAGCWLYLGTAFTREIPAELRSRFDGRKTAQPRRAVLAWARPELTGEFVTTTCREKSCVRPSHSAGTGREFRLPPNHGGRRAPSHGRSDPRTVARETRAFLDMAHHIGPEDARALVRTALTLSAFGIDPTELLRGEV